jgi:hypothetical protein
MIPAFERHKTIRTLDRTATGAGEIKFTALLLYYFTNSKEGNGPVSIAERSKACTVYDRLNIRISGSNPAWGMDVCPRVSMLCCPVSVEALRRADPPAKES